MWYKRAAEAGNVDSMVNLGRLVPLPCEVFAAIQSCLVTTTMCYAAYCYADGIGVREDMSMYESWIQRAANAGSAKAASLLKMHQGRM